MTISIKVSVNGNYKCPVSYKQGDRQENHVISGFGRDTPNDLYIPFYHSPDAMTLSVGPEEPDNGAEAELGVTRTKPGDVQPADSGGQPQPPPPPPHQ